MTGKARAALAAAVVLALAAGWWVSGRAADDKKAQDNGVAAARKDAKAASAPRAALTVTATVPQEAQWAVNVPANGSIAAWQEAIVGAEIGGLRLVEVPAGVGDRVKKGQVLARLQSETTAAEVAATRANLAEARALQAEAQANAERARQLQATGAISAQQIQQYVTGEQTAKARVDALRARLAADELRLAQTRIVAPDDGVISARIATVGAVVQPGQDLFRLIRQHRLEWRGELPAEQLLRVKPGMAARIVLAGGEIVAGKVRMVAPTVDTQTRNGLVYVDLAQPGAAKAGMFARGEFDIGTARGLTLPQSAVLLREGFSYVFAIQPDSRVRELKVTTGRRQGDRIEITGGLDPKAQVVASGGGFLADGDTVRVVAK